MKKSLKNTVAILLSLYFIGFGCGINIIHYCCKACAEYGISNFNYVSCEQVHEHHHCTEHPDGCDLNHNHGTYKVNSDDFDIHLRTDETHCSSERYSIEEYSLVSYLFHFNSELLYCLLPMLTQQVSTSNGYLASTNFKHAPPLSDGRTLLIKHATLLI